MDNLRNKLEKFIRQQLFRPRDDSSLERFVLRSAGVGSRGAEVESFPVPSEINGDNMGTLVDEISTRAQADADGMGSNNPTRYIVIALEVGKSDGPRFPFRLRGEGGEEDGEEPPTERGLMAQMMRHNEALMRMAVQAVGTASNQMAKRIEAVERQNIDLQQARANYLDEAEAAKSEQHTRDIQLMITSGTEDRKGELFKKLDLLLPLIVNKISGQPVLPTGQDGDVFTKLANSLSPEQLGQMAPFLSQEQQVLLLTLLKSAREKSAPKEQ